MKFYKDFIIYDVETSGINKKSDSILSLSAIKVKNMEIVDTLSTFVKYEHDYLDPVVSELTGITLEDVKKDNLPSQSQAVEMFKTFVEDLPIGGFNSISFDNQFIEKFDFSFKDKVQFDVYRLVQMYNPFNTENLKLETFAKLFDISQSHDSLSDCQTTFILLQKLYEIYSTLDTRFGEIVNEWDDVLIDVAHSANNKLKLFEGSRVHIVEYDICDVKGAHKYFVSCQSNRGLMTMFTDNVNTLKMFKNR